MSEEYIPDEWEIDNRNISYVPEGVEDYLKSDPFHAKCTHMGLNFVGYIMWDHISEDFINEIWLVDDIDLPQEDGRPMPYSIERANSFENVVKRTNNELGWE